MRRAEWVVLGLCLLFSGCAGSADDDVSTDDDTAMPDDDTVMPDDDAGDDDMADDDTGDDDTQSSGPPAYPSAAFETVLLSGAGVCHGEGSPWGYAQNANVMSISWRELDGKTSVEIEAAVAAYIDGIGTPTMLVVLLGGQTATEPPEPYYPLGKEDIGGYLLNVGTDSVTPDLANADFQADLDTFLPLYGQGLRDALTGPGRRDKVIASIGWLGSYSECHYSSSGAPSQADLAITMAKFHTHVGQVAEIPVVFHITGRHDIAEAIWADSALLDAIGDHHLWFKINGFHCAEPEDGNCLSEDYASTQTDVLVELRAMGANVGWEPKHPVHFSEASALAQATGIALSLDAGASFACSQSVDMAEVMDGLLSGVFQIPTPWP